MKVRQVVAVLAVLVIGLLVGSLVSGMFSAGFDASPSWGASRPAPDGFLMVHTGGECLVAIPTPTATQWAVPAKEEDFVAANADAAVLFGSRPALSNDVVRAHATCVRWILGYLDFHPRAATMDKTIMVRAALETFPLGDVQVREEPAGWLTFSASTGLACIVGVHHAGEASVAVIAPLPNGKCLN
jgi:hypothetical protein